jgi:hypothetical protein
MPAKDSYENIGSAAKAFYQAFIDRLSITEYIEIPEISDPSNPATNYGRLYVNDATGTTSLMFRDSTGTETNLLTSGTGGTLDQAYDQGGAGSGKAITTSDGAVALSNTDADAAYQLTINASPSGSAAAGGMEITLGANSTQSALAITNSGSGNDIIGSGGTWQINKTGTATLTGLSLGSGDLNIIGATSLGNGTDTVEVDSTSWDVSTAGAFTGVTSISLSDDITFATGNGIKPSTTTAETLSIMAYDVDGATYRDAILLTNGNNPAILFGTNNETVAVNSADWDISTAGAMTGIGAITMDGLLTGSLGATITGAVVNLNASSNFATNINTGTTNAALSLGGGSGTVAVNSTTWDISTAGALTGIADITGTAGEAMTMTLAANGAADDLTISVTGAQDSSLALASAGTAADAFNVATTAGGMLFSPSGAMADQFKVAAAGAIAGNAINLGTTDGGIVLTAGGAANGDMTLTVGDDLSIAATGTAAITTADWGVSATGAQTGIASTTYDSGTGVYFDTVECNNACIKGLRASKLELTAAPGAANFIELVSAVFVLDYGSEVLTVNAADNLVVEYETSGQDATAAIETDGFVTAAADTVQLVPAASIATVPAANVLNKKLLLFNVGGAEIAGNASNDSTMTIKLAYRVHAGGL